MKDASAQALLDDVVVRSTKELFAAYGVHLTACEPPPRATGEMLFAAVIGFSGTGLRGTLLLAPTTEAVAHFALGSPEQVRDWVGELSNQLLGRIKHKLFAYGLTIYMTTPLVIRGERLAPVVDARERPYQFDACPGGVSIWFDVEEVGSLKLVPAGANDVPAAGEAVFF